MALQENSGIASGLHAITPTPIRLAPLEFRDEMIVLIGLFRAEVSQSFAGDANQAICRRENVARVFVPRVHQPTTKAAQICSIEKNDLGCGRHNFSWCARAGRRHKTRDDPSAPCKAQPWLEKRKASLNPEDQRVAQVEKRQRLQSAHLRLSLL